jgi:hypothetical protein
VKRASRETAERHHSQSVFPRQWRAAMSASSSCGALPFAHFLQARARGWPASGAAIAPPCRCLRAGDGAAITPFPWRPQSDARRVRQA